MFPPYSHPNVFWLTKVTPGTVGASPGGLFVPFPAFVGSFLFQPTKSHQLWGQIATSFHLLGGSEHDDLSPPLSRFLHNPVTGNPRINSLRSCESMHQHRRISLQVEGCFCHVHRASVPSAHRLPPSWFWSPLNPGFFPPQPWRSFSFNFFYVQVGSPSEVSRVLLDVGSELILGPPPWPSWFSPVIAFIVRLPAGPLPGCQFFSCFSVSPFPFAAFFGTKSSFMIDPPVFCRHRLPPLPRDLFSPTSPSLRPNWPEQHFGPLSPPLPYVFPLSYQPEDQTFPLIN